MINKKSFLIIGTALLAVASVASSAILTQNVLKVTSLDSVQWNHYNAVAAGLGTKGIREYWVSCSDHSIQFTAPESDNIVNKGTPSQSFIDSLDSNDDRLIPAYKRFYDFEDGVLPSFFTIRQNVSGITVGDSLNSGKHTVEISVTANDYGVNLDKAYLDAAFSDLNVTAVAFDAYSTEATSNFRHRHNGLNTCYEKNEEQSTQTGYGLVTGGFKSFYFTRSMYSSWVDGDCVIWGGGSVASKTVYIDNLRVVSKTSANLAQDDVIDFDTGAFNTNANDFRNMSGTAIFAANTGASGVYPSFNYQYKTSGTRSVAINKSTSSAASVTINKNANFFKNRPDEGFLVDIRSTANHNHSVGIKNGQSSDNTPWSGSTGESGGNLIAGRWYTYLIKPSDVNENGRFMQFPASTTAEWYIDNLRYVTGNVYGFEGACVQRSADNAYVTVAGQEFAAEDSGILRDRTQCYNFIMNVGTTMVTYAGLDEEHVTEGAQALKVTFEHTGYNMMHFEPYLIEGLDSTDEISIDVYSDGVTFASGSLFEDVTPGEWTTVTISKSQLSADGGQYGRLTAKCYRTQANISHVGSVWFDNIRTTNVD